MDTTTEREPSEVLTPDCSNATFFNPEESNHPQKFEMFRLYNRNTWKDRREENKEVKYRQDNLAILDAISSQLSLNDFQKAEARRFFDRIHIHDVGKSVKLIAFGICTIVVNEDVPNGSRYHPHMEDPDDQFESLIDELGFTESQVHSILGFIRNLRSSDDF